MSSDLEGEAAVSEDRDKYDFSDIELPTDASSERASLSEMLAEGRVVQGRGMSFVAVPPTIRELGRVLPIVNQIGAMGESAVGESLVLTVKAACYLLWVEQDGELRRATPEEVAGAFRPAGLSRLIGELLADQGLKQDADSGE
jgi:hypothetical protein